ncbi:SDR family NAD(P)-dependent oxidoreductase [Brucepastera parasyntrophica]|uniref:SDR family NAD(P)-dependent oxidoreductase n=1 Tax=Brucepastera parasyntrophica TaxID=2880008 RepID=UPI00210AE323|nr:SDR family NAD(P)-dependent oxidoreductase [Brucepastera parasyntrophica]ULQ58817.1 SDR family NAD(P)-dependent oxidoreductase [Brucepastera parasyntrophica]
MKRIIIVTGASSGIGREFAFQLAEARTADEIWLLARREDKLQALAEEINARDSGRGITVRTVPVDLTGTGGVRSFTALLEEEKKRDNEFVIDTLVNNAGFGTYGTFMETSIDRQLEMIQLNVITLTGLCHAAIPCMDRGSILINVSSLAAFAPLGNFAVYGATKAYVLSFTLALAAETADSGIFICALCPGPVDTEFAKVASNGARVKVLHGASPQKLVTHCLRRIHRGSHTIVMLMKWKFKAFMSRFIGRYWFARYTFVHEKRPSGPAE